MAYKPLFALLDVLPCLHRWGYTPTECSVLIAIANRENSKAHKRMADAISAGNSPADEDEKRAACRASYRKLAHDSGTSERHVQSTMDKALRDGIIYRIPAACENQPHRHGINLPAVKCLTAWAKELEAASDNQSARDRRARKPRPVPVDYAPYLTAENVPDWVRSCNPGWTSGDGMELWRCNGTHIRDAIYVYLRVTRDLTRYKVSRGTRPVANTGKTALCVWLEPCTAGATILDQDQAPPLTCAPTLARSDRDDGKRAAPALDRERHSNADDDYREDDGNGCLDEDDDEDSGDE